jgi:hypothetical protein
MRTSLVLLGLVVVALAIVSVSAQGSEPAPRTIGDSSAYRRGQHGQAKDAQGRHHAASSGRYQKETATNSQGQKFDRRTGRVISGAPIVCPLNLLEVDGESFLEVDNEGADLTAAEQEYCEAQRKKYAAAHAAAAAEAKANGASPQGVANAAKIAKLEAIIKDNRKKIAKNAKRTIGESSAYRRGQHGQFKDENNRHHAASSGRFQSETATNSQGQKFDRRTGRIKASKKQ